MKRFKIVLVLLVCMLLGGCKKEEETNYTQLTQKDAGEPYSNWGYMSTGSARYLDGTSVLVTIYLDDTNSQWLESDEELVANNVKVACDYIIEEGKRYGKDVKLIYDTSVDGELTYRISYKEAFSGRTEATAKGDKTDKLVYSMYDYIENKIDTEAILKKYNANSIGYMVFIDGEADACTAYCYNPGYKRNFYEEFCLINLRWTGGENVNPDTYAHEILHLFGARDLYYTSEYHGISKNFVEHVYNEHSKDIMLGYAADVFSYSDTIEAEVSDITAYFLGWTDDISELDEFPYIKTKYSASFTKAEGTEGVNFLEFDPPARKQRGEEGDNLKNAMISSELVSAIVIGAFAIFALIRFVVVEHREKKNKETYRVISQSDWNDEEL